MRKMLKSPMSCSSCKNDEALFASAMAFVEGVHSEQLTHGSWVMALACIDSLALI